MSADAKRVAVAAKGSLPSAKRGRLCERTWADVRRAARVAREEGVKLRVHHRCVDIIGVLKQHTKVPCKVVSKVQKKPTETVAPTLPSATAGEAPPPPLSKRKQRSAQRLQDFLERKRAAAVAELVAKGYRLEVVRGVVARAESKRLERIQAARAAAGAPTPMELWRIAVDEEAGGGASAPSRDASGDEPMGEG